VNYTVSRTISLMPSATSNIPRGRSSILVIMGVSGSGKTTIGQLLSAELICSFIDGDDFHPPVNIKKMSSGEALTDEDRWPWLEILTDKIQEYIQQEQSMVLACSALKKSYREILCVERELVQFIYLKGNYATIVRRMQSRENHFMTKSLLQSQFATLEEPEDAIVVDISPSPSEILKSIRGLLHLKASPET
jgi:gluconokinase